MEKKVGLILGGIFLFSLVLVVGFAMAATQATSATVTVNTFLSVTIDDIPITFGSLNPGDENKKPTNDPLVATIGPETNVGSIFVKTKANNVDFVDGIKNFPVNNLEWDSVDTFPGVDYTTTPASVCASVVPGNTCDIFHELTIPGNQAAGPYDLAITISVTV